VAHICGTAVSAMVLSIDLDDNLQMHRKEKKTYNIPGHTHYLTFSCYQQWPLLCKDTSRQWVIESIKQAKKEFEFEIYAYVIMPEHVHLLIKPRLEIYKIERILAGLKRPVSRRARQYLEEKGELEFLNKLMVEKGGKKIFRFWLPGGGYDKNISKEKAIKPIIEYMHKNPVRRGLVEKSTDWIWSSAQYWAGWDNVPLDMDSIYY